MLFLGGSMSLSTITVADSKINLESAKSGSSVNEPDVWPNVWWSKTEEENKVTPLAAINCNVKVRGNDVICNLS